MDVNELKGVLFKDNSDNIIFQIKRVSLRPLARVAFLPSRYFFQSRLRKTILQFWM